MVWHGITLQQLPPTTHRPPTPHLKGQGLFSFIEGNAIEAGRGPVGLVLVPPQIILNCTLLQYTGLHCTLCTTLNTLYTLHYTLYTLYTVHYTLYTVHWALCSEHCIFCTEYCTQHTLIFSLRFSFFLKNTWQSWGAQTRGQWRAVSDEPVTGYNLTFKKICICL